MRRDLWTKNITKHSCPSWACTVCNKGTLRLVKDSLEFKETIESVRLRKDEEFFYPERIEYAFTAWAQCSHPACQQQYAIAGSGGVEQQTSADDGDCVDYFSPKICFPMPDIFDLPTRCPKNVDEALHSAFRVFWLNPAACANQIRVSLEYLMDHVSVPRTRESSKGKSEELKLDARIKIFTEEEAVLGGQLMALKWLGNTASHEGEVSKNDLLDAFEIMEHTLKEIIDRPSAKVAALAQNLTDKHEKKKG